MLFFREKRPSKDQFGNVQFLKNSTGNFTVYDQTGNQAINNLQISLPPFDAENSSDASPDGRGFYKFTYEPGIPPLKPGNYVIVFTITDNLSGEKITKKENMAIVSTTAG